MSPGVMTTALICLMVCHNSLYMHMLESELLKFAKAVVEIGCLCSRKRF